jgi:hypothetical protein
MPSITLNAHFDGRTITLDEPFEIPSNSKLLVTVLAAPTAVPTEDHWLAFSLAQLARAYSTEEPAYPLSLLKELNPSHE